MVLLKFASLTSYKAGRPCFMLTFNFAFIPEKKNLLLFYWQSSACHDFFFLLQYIYETNENGDKVVLGKGTYGVVYAGRDLSNQVRIAIKEIPEKDSTYEEQK